MRKRLLISLVAATAAGMVHAQEPLGTFDWKSLSDSGALRSGSVTQTDGRTALKIENLSDTALQTQLIVIKQPAITLMAYAITGEIRYENVSGDGFLEMWSCFPPPKPGAMEGRYFSRTLGLSGPDGKVTGTSGWRPFVLPFNRTGTASSPTRLEINLFLPGKGVVYIGPITLQQYQGSPEPILTSAIPKLWGMGAGLCGAVLGILAGVFWRAAARGRARALVMLATKVLALCGMIVFALGVAIIIRGSLDGPGLPVAACGALMAAIFIVLHRRLVKSYEEVEIRRMASLDASGA